MVAASLEGLSLLEGNRKTPRVKPIICQLSFDSYQLSIEFSQWSVGN
jgi:hypothetical protein